VGGVERSNDYSYRCRGLLQRLMISHVVLMILVSGVSFGLACVALRCSSRIGIWKGAMERVSTGLLGFSFFVGFVLVFCLA